MSEGETRKEQIYLACRLLDTFSFLCHSSDNSSKDVPQPSNVQGSNSTCPVSPGCSRPEGAEDKFQASQAAAGLQHGVISSHQALLSESLSLALWHSSVTMASRISPAVCHCCHAESRNGSRLKSVHAFTPFRHLGSVTAAQTEPTRPALRDITWTQKVLWVLTTGCPGLCPSVHPIASSAPWGSPNQGSAPLMWGLATVTCRRVWSCRHPAASVGSRDLRKHCESPLFGVPAALPCCLIPAALLPSCHSHCHRHTVHLTGSQVPQGQQQGPLIPTGAVGMCLAPQRQGVGST